MTDEFLQPFGKPYTATPIPQNSKDEIRNNWRGKTGLTGKLFHTQFNFFSLI